MKVKYDSEADALYIELEATTSLPSVSIKILLWTVKQKVV